MISVGIVIRRSTNLMISWSTHLPKYPAIAPRVVPRKAATAPITNITVMDC